MKKFFLILGLSFVMILCDYYELISSAPQLFESNQGQYDSCEYAVTRTKWSSFLNKNEMLICFTDSVTYKNSKNSLVFVAKLKPLKKDIHIEYFPLNLSNVKFNYYINDKLIENVDCYTKLRLNIDNFSIAEIYYDNKNIPRFEQITKRKITDYIEIEFIDYSENKCPEESKLFEIFKTIVYHQFISDATLAKVEWSTFIGGSSRDIGIGISINENNDQIVMCGTTKSYNYPLKNNDYYYYGNFDGFVSKFDKNGNLISSTYIGGANEDGLFKCLIDKDNSIWICGQSASQSFPITKDAYQKSNAGGTDDGVVAHLDENGKLLYSTFLGTDSYDSFVGIAKDDFGNIWFSGRTFGSGLRFTNNAFQKYKSNFYDGFILKIKNHQVLLCSYLGFNSDDSIEEIAVNSKGEPIIIGFTLSTDLWVNNNAFQNSLAGGRDAWVAKLDPETGQPIWSTYIGGEKDEIGYNISLNNKDIIAISGYTSSNDFPVSEDAFQKKFGGNRDYFVVYMNDDGELFYSTFFGGSDFEGADDWSTHHGGIISIDDRIIFGGSTLSTNIPISKDAYQQKNNGKRDSFYGVINLNGKLEYCTYFGGSEDEWTRDVAFSYPNNIYVSGFTNSNDFPTTSNAFQKNKSGDFDAFIIKFSDFLPETDTIKPVFTSSLAECNGLAKIIVSDPNLKNVEIIKNINCIFSSKNLNDTCIEVTFVALPNVSDFEYEINAIDEFGNVRVIKNKIFKIASVFKFIPNSFDDKQFDFDSIGVGKSLCLPVKIVNTSNYDASIDSSYLYYNFIFSLPHSQLPIIIPANDTIDLYVCYSPSKLSKIDRDTLIIVDKCSSLRIPLMGVAVKWQMNANSKCNANIGMTVSADLKPDKAVVVPNPSSGIIQLHFDGNLYSFKKVYLFNCIGQKLLEYQGKDCEFDISKLNSGFYYVIIEQNNLIFHSSFIKE